MSKSAIKNIFAYECLDSRGFPTVSATVELESGHSGTAAVPSGASTGEYEAVELRDGDKKRFHGKGVTKAIENIKTKILPAVKGKDAANQSELDKLMIELDGSDNKGVLGANAILAVSLAAAKAAASLSGKELYSYLGGDKGTLLPVPLVNVINGGAHAANSLDFQEFMLVPHSGATFSENIRMACEVFQTLKKNLVKKGMSVGIGDEGGFAPNLPSTEETIQTLMEAIADTGYQPGKDIALALDVAASEMFDDSKGMYVFKKSCGKAYSSAEMVAMYKSWSEKFPLVSIEDGLDENDWDGWNLMTKEIGNKVQLVGDDLFVTNVKRLQMGINQATANSILIKVNQIGSLTETLSTIALAHEHKYTTVMSHRSGETEDTTIADLAVATRSGQIKTGSVCRSERTAKYNRLLWIEAQLGARAEMAKPFKI
jgi:enolase